VCKNDFFKIASSAPCHLIPSVSAAAQSHSPHPDNETLYRDACLIACTGNAYLHKKLEEKL